MSDDRSTGPGARRRVSKRWVVEYVGVVGKNRVFRYHWSPVVQSLDSHVRKWPVVSSRGGWYTVQTYTLAEDIAFAVRCARRRWSYEGYRRRRRVREYGERGISRRLALGRRMSLVTLPFPGADAKDLYSAFRLLVKRLRRQQGVVEFWGVRAVGSKSGVLHVHAVMDMGYLRGGQARLSELWLGITGFGVVDIREVKSAGAARYVAAQVTGYVAEQGTGRMLVSKGWLGEQQQDSAEDGSGAERAGTGGAAVGETREARSA